MLFPPRGEMEEEEAMTLTETVTGGVALHTTTLHVVGVTVPLVVAMVVVVVVVHSGGQGLDHPFVEMPMMIVVEEDMVMGVVVVVVVVMTTRKTLVQVAIAIGAIVVVVVDHILLLAGTMVVVVVVGIMGTVVAVAMIEGEMWGATPGVILLHEVIPTTAIVTLMPEEGMVRMLHEMPTLLLLRLLHLHIVTAILLLVGAAHARVQLAVPIMIQGINREILVATVGG